MISVSFVNNTIKPIRVNDDINAIFNIIKESNDTIKSLINDYITGSENQMMNEAVGLYIEEEDDLVEEIQKKNSGIFDKIGEAILSIFKKVQEFINKVRMSIKDVMFRFSPIEKKIDMIKKSDPEIANKIIAEIDEGNISIIDLKNLKEVEQIYQEILEDAKKKEIDSHTMRGKAELLKNKFDDLLAEKNKTFTKIINAATLISLVGGIIFAKSAWNKIHEADYKIKVLSSKDFDSVRKTIYDMQKLHMHKALNADELTKMQILSNVSCVQQGKFSKIITHNSEQMKVLNSIINKILSTLGQDTDAKEFMKYVNKMNKMDVIDGKLK